jgi:ATP-binding cassette, subfamily B, bacterial PglK
MGAFVKLLKLFNPQEYLALVGLILLMIFVGIVEVLGVASVMPFMAVLANPDLTKIHPGIVRLVNAFGSTEPRQMVLVLGVMSLLFLLVSNIVAMLANWAITRFTYQKGHALSEGLLQHYMSLPYDQFANLNPADLQKNVLSEVDRVTIGAILPALQVLAKSFVAIMLLATLFVIDHGLSLMLGAGFGGCYLLIYLGLKKWFAQSGEHSFRANGERFRFSASLLGGIKELRILGTVDPMLDRYHEASLQFAQYQSRNHIARPLIRYIVESVAFGGVISVVLFLALQGREIGEILPTLSLYALVGYRLLPALQHIFAGMTSISHHMAGLNMLSDTVAHLTRAEHVGSPTEGPCPRREIELSQISYKYPGRSNLVLDNISVQIPIGANVAFIGRSGSGKTTAVEILCGLLHPAAGKIFVDGQLLTPEDLPGLQRSLGYVAQNTYLMDDSVAANIAFGVPANAIDMAAVEYAARQANIHEFIVKTLPAGYDTPVGERGVRLSGGQRQRIGIARALYGNPPILIFDEGTSALDHETEAAILETIRTLSSHKTIVMISHRLQTIKNCSPVYQFKDGKVIKTERISDEMLQAIVAANP